MSLALRSGFRPARTSLLKTLPLPLRVHSRDDSRQTDSDPSLPLAAHPESATATDLADFEEIAPTTQQGADDGVY